MYEFSVYEVSVYISKSAADDPVVSDEERSLFQSSTLGELLVKVRAWAGEMKATSSHVYDDHYLIDMENLTLKTEFIGPGCGALSPEESAIVYEEMAKLQG